MYIHRQRWALHGYKAQFFENNYFQVIVEQRFAGYNQTDIMQASDTAWKITHVSINRGAQLSKHSVGIISRVY